MDTLWVLYKSSLFNLMMSTWGFFFCDNSQSLGHYGYPIMPYMYVVSIAFGCDDHYHIYMCIFYGDDHYQMLLQFADQIKSAALTN